MSTGHLPNISRAINWQHRTINVATVTCTTNNTGHNTIAHFTYRTMMDITPHSHTSPVVSRHFGPRTLDTSAELSGHIGTIAEVSVRHFGNHGGLCLCNYMN